MRARRCAMAGPGVRASPGVRRRRLRAESVVLLLAEREPGDAFRGLTELVVGGLPAADARTLLRPASRAGWTNASSTRCSRTHGNPFALLELSRGLTAAQLAGGFALVGALSLQGRIEESFLTPLRHCPTTPSGVVGRGGGTHRRSERAVACRRVARHRRRGARAGGVAGLIEVAGRVRFHHPLVRSAVYGAASPPQRRAVHRALAEAADAQADPSAPLAPGRRGRGTRGGRCGELKRAASRAQARGGLAVAAAFLERAAAPAPEQSVAGGVPWRRRRQHSRQAASTTRSPCSPPLGRVPPARTAGADLLRAQIAFASRRGADAPVLLLRAARELEAFDAAAAATYVEALRAAMLARGPARAGVAEVSAAALAGPPPPSPAGPPIFCSRGWRSGSPGTMRRVSRL